MGGQSASRTGDIARRNETTASTSRGRGQQRTNRRTNR